MIKTKAEYIEAIKELKDITLKAKNFNPEKLIAQKYPLWLIREQGEYYEQRIKELKILLDNCPPKFKFRSKRRSYNRR